MNIPIFRAKKIASDDYIIGYLLPEYKGKFYLATEWSKDFDGDTPNFIQIDISTISIHFPSMLAEDSNSYDSNGEKDLRIFASLEEFGKGGDIVTDGEYDFVVIFNGRSFDLMFVEDNTFAKFNEWDDWDSFAKKGKKRY